MRCPKCGSENVIEKSTTFPAIYECQDCKFVFTVNKNPFIDE